MYSLFRSALIRDKFLDRAIKLAKETRQKILNLDNANEAGYDYSKELTVFIKDPKNLHKRIDEWVLNVVIDEYFYNDLIAFIKQEILNPESPKIKRLNELEEKIETTKKAITLVNIKDYVNNDFFGKANIIHKEIAKLAKHRFNYEFNSYLGHKINHELANISEFDENPTLCTLSQ